MLWPAAALETVFTLREKNLRVNLCLSLI